MINGLNKQAYGDIQLRRYLSALTVVSTVRPLLGSCRNGQQINLSQKHLLCWEYIV